MDRVDRYQSVQDQYEQAYRSACAAEMWEFAARVRGQQADWAFDQERRSDFRGFLDDAIRLADDHQLPELAQELRLRLSSFLLGRDPTCEIAEDVREAASTKGQSSLTLDELMLQANQAVSAGEFDSAAEDLQRADELALKIPEKRWTIQLELARVYEALNDIETAVEHAEKSLEIARGLQMPMVIAQTLQSLILLRQRMPEEHQCTLDREIEELQAVGSADDVGMTWLLCAQRHQADARFECALSDLALAMKAQPGRMTRRLIVKQRVLALYELGRYEEALNATHEAISLLDDAMTRDAGQSSSEWRDRLAEVEGLHMMAAWLHAKRQQTTEAFQILDAGLAQSLRRQFELVGCASKAEIKPVSFKEVREWLVADSAAIVVFAVTRWGTLGLVLSPEASEPIAFELPLTGADLQKLVPSEYSEIWTAKILDAVPSLSEKLLYPMADTLQGIAQRCRVLYVVPDGPLYLVPFAALMVTDNVRLIECCPLALTPSVGILKSLRARRSNEKKHLCVAVGAGSEDDGKISFAEHAKAIASYPWTDCKLLLDDSTADQFLAAITGPSVIHVSCHGNVSEEIVDTLSASQLMFPDRLLSGRELIPLAGQVRASLVFLNACQSGRFRPSLRSEVNGFVRGFLHAGAATLIAPLVHVDPRSAQRLAERFYREWLNTDATKAEALHRAQLSMLRDDVELYEWAAYALYGDHQ